MYIILFIHFCNENKSKHNIFLSFDQNFKPGLLFIKGSIYKYDIYDRISDF